MITKFQNPLNSSLPLARYLITLVGVSSILTSMQAVFILFYHLSHATYGDHGDVHTVRL
jgi:hypothetical protein